MSQRVKEFALNHLIYKLQGQQEYIVALRNQAGISAAVSGLIASVFAGLLAKDTGAMFTKDFLGFSITGILALSLFSASIAFSAMVLIHHSNFTFCFDTGKMLMMVESGKSESDFYEKYIDDGEYFFAENESLITEAQHKLWFAMVFGFVQILPWILLVGAHHE